jgi:hypothetical protein
MDRFIAELSWHVSCFYRENSFMEVCMFIVIWFSAVIVGAIIGSGKGKTGTGVVLTLLLSWIGVIIIAVMSPSEEFLDEQKREEEKRLLEKGEMKKCAFCGELIKTEALVCRHCGKEVIAAAE